MSPGDMLTVSVLEPLLDRIGNRLQGEPGLRLEWSLQVRGGGILVRDRISCWVEADAGSPARFASMGLLLADLAAPSAVVRAQSLRSPGSIAQGVGLVRAGDGVEWRLYLHDRDPETRAERYEAFRWRAGEESVDVASYRFHYFPETPEGEGPVDLVHPSFSSVVQSLLRDERLQQLSGFWIRRRGDDCDQVDLAYPWHPPLAEVSEALRAGTGDRLDAWADHPLRHLAFSAGPRAPSVTVYFSAPANGRIQILIGGLPRIAGDRKPVPVPVNGPTEVPVRTSHQIPVIVNWIVPREPLVNCGTKAKGLVLLNSFQCRPKSMNLIVPITCDAAPPPSPAASATVFTSKVNAESVPRQKDIASIY